VARGKYRGARQEGDYYLDDSDLEGRYLDGLSFGDVGARRSHVDDDADDAEDAATGDGDGDGEDLFDARAGDEYEDGDGEDTAEPATAPGGPKPSLRIRLATAIAPKPPAPRAPRQPLAPRTPRTPAQRTAASSTRPDRPARQQVVVPEGKTIEDLINNLDDKERLIALTAAVLGVAYAIFIAIYYAHPKPSKTPQVNASLVAAIFGVPALLTGVAVFIGRRALVGFLALLTGFAVLTFVQPIAGALYFGLGIWLIMKAQRYTRYAREQSGETRPRREPRTRTAAGAGPAKPASRSRGTAAATTKGPVASKRYTPPRSSQPQTRRSRAR
jgi:hypothetical protein